MKRVTPAKLIAASRALIALSGCDDWDEMTLAKWESMPDDQLHRDGLPNQLQLAVMANEMSGMLDAFLEPEAGVLLEVQS